MPFNDRSKHITQGVARSPNRAMYYALGYEKADFDKPESAVVGTEFTGTSISTGGDGADTRAGMDKIMSENPQLKFFNAQRGYVRCSVTPASNSAYRGRRTSRCGPVTTCCTSRRSCARGTRSRRSCLLRKYLSTRRSTRRSARRACSRRIARYDGAILNCR